MEINLLNLFFNISPERERKKFSGIKKEEVNSSQRFIKSHFS